jgi:hypothetical protein
MATTYTDITLSKFNEQIRSMEALVNSVRSDVECLVKYAALDSFIHTFCEGYDDLFAILESTQKRNVPFVDQVHANNDTLFIYVDNYGNKWTFDRQNPQLGWR